LPITNELPSAGWRAAYSRPIDPFAPDLFSTITDWPHISFNFCAMIRDMMSDAPPGG
jgi:hypothetical protein